MKPVNTKPYGSLTIRFLAWLFDGLLLSLVPLTLLLLVFSTANDSGGYWVGILWFIWELVFFQWFLVLVYRIYTMLVLGGSLGKILAGLRIQKEDGSKLRLADAIMRFPVGYTVSSVFWNLGFFWIYRDAKKQGFHDQIAGTVVVKTESGRSLFILLPLLGFIFGYLVVAIFQIGSDRGIWMALGYDIRDFLGQLQINLGK